MLLLKKIIPYKIIFYYRVLKSINVYLYDIKRFVRDKVNEKEHFEQKIKRDLTILYHIVEKGLTMPETRIGFGQPIILKLISIVHDYENHGYSKNDIEFKQAVSVLKEYYEFHNQNRFVFEDTIQHRLSEISQKYQEVEGEKQKHFSYVQYFQNINKEFDIFCRSRYSIRNYSIKSIPAEIIKECIELAQRSPSFCNRQPSRVHVVKNSETKKKVLELQNGNRGFGHLSDTLFVITSIVSKTVDLNERHENYLNSGMFSMTLLYALHYKKIGACCLNWSVSKEKDMLLRKLLNIKDNEVVIIIISAGYPPETFQVAASPRLSAREITIYN